MIALSRRDTLVGRSESMQQPIRLVVLEPTTSKHKQNPCYVELIAGQEGGRLLVTVLCTMAG